MLKFNKIKFDRAFAEFLNTLSIVQDMKLEYEADFKSEATIIPLGSNLLL